MELVSVKISSFFLGAIFFLVVTLHVFEKYMLSLETLLFLKYFFSRK